MYCHICGSFKTEIKNFDLVCGKCGEQERIEQAVLRSIQDLKILFPEIKITTQIINEWCDGKISKKTITKILKNNYVSTGRTSDTYYE